MTFLLATDQLSQLENLVNKIHSINFDILASFILLQHRCFQRFYLMITESDIIFCCDIHSSSDQWLYSARVPLWLNSSPGSRLGGLKRIAPTTKSQTSKRTKVPITEGSRCFAVMYAKPQTRKNKIWEDDGYLFLTNDNTMLSLRNVQVCSNQTI